MYPSTRMPITFFFLAAEKQRMQSYKVNFTEKGYNNFCIFELRSITYFPFHRFALFKDLLLN